MKFCILALFFPLLIVVVQCESTFTLEKLISYMLGNSSHIKEREKEISPRGNTSNHGRAPTDCKIDMRLGKDPMDKMPVISELPVIKNRQGKDITDGKGVVVAKLLRPKVIKNNADIVIKNNGKVAFSCPSAPFDNKYNGFKNYLQGLTIKGLAASCRNGKWDVEEMYGSTQSSENSQVSNEGKVLATFGCKNLPLAETHLVVNNPSCDGAGTGIVEYQTAFKFKMWYANENTQRRTSEIILDPIYKSCYNPKTGQSVWIQQRIPKEYKEKIIPPRENGEDPSWAMNKDAVNPLVNYSENLETSYERGTNVQNNILSRYKIKSGLYIDLRPENMELGYFLTRGHFAARGDFMNIFEQRSTFNYINQAPQWQSFNSGNWNQLEKNIRAYQNGNDKRDIIIYTGIHGVMVLKDQGGVNKPIYFNVARDQMFPVPLFYWKIIILTGNLKNLIMIFGINNPHIEEKDVDLKSKNSLPKSVCKNPIEISKVPNSYRPFLKNMETNMQKIDRNDVNVKPNNKLGISKGFMFGCAIQDVKKNVQRPTSAKMKADLKTAT